MLAGWQASGGKGLVRLEGVRGVASRWWCLDVREGRCGGLGENYFFHPDVIMLPNEIIDDRS